ncbi:MAG: sulfatase-like hydrolase/transferase [Bacteroidia bacterium]|nr:sulfatase-like hydrolase/transferase [Bacteroidia bacterium]
METKMLFKPITLGFVFTFGFQLNLAAQKPLNILIIQTDEHNPRMFGAAGDPFAITPNMDKLARQGVLFSNAYSQNPISVPSRMSMLTGKYSQTIKVYGNGDPLTMNFTTFADQFNKNGYRSAIIGKMHFKGKGDEQLHGFERPFGDSGSEIISGNWEKKQLDKLGQTLLSDRSPKLARVNDFPMEVHKDGGIVPYTKTFLSKNKENPFILICSFTRPHFPFEASDKYYEMYKGRVKLPIDFDSDKKNWSVSSQMENSKYKFDQLTKEEIIHAREVYYGMITWVDDQIGLILDELDRQGLKENTLIIYTADHGEMAGEHCLWYKNTFYEGSAGIPFIISCPKLFRGNQISKSVTGNIDIFPTICDAAGIQKPDGLEGKSLWPVLTGKESGNDRYIFSENYRGGIPGCMVCDQNWKYFVYQPCEKNMFTKEVFLYDMINDPNEMQNLANHAELKSVVENMEKRMSWWKPGKIIINDNETSAIYRFP